MTASLEEQLNKAMHNIYVRAKEEAGYNASYFLHMLGDLGGFGTAKSLIDAAKISDGFTALWERGRLDLTVEAVILERIEFHDLFTEDELSICRKRLNQLGYRG